MAGKLTTADEIKVPRTRYGTIGCMLCPWQSRRKARIGWARGLGNPVTLTTCEEHAPRTDGLFVFAVRIA